MTRYKPAPFENRKLPKGRHRKPVMVSLSDEEVAEIAKVCKRLNLNRSQLLRRVFRLAEYLLTDASIRAYTAQFGLSTEEFLRHVISVWRNQVEPLIPIPEHLVSRHNKTD